MDGEPNRKEPIPFNLTDYIESYCESGDENNLLYASFSNTSFKFNNSTCQNQSLIDEAKQARFVLAGERGRVEDEWLFSREREAIYCGSLLTKKTNKHEKTAADLQENN